MKTKDLIPYENNPRLNAHAVQYVANSIREFGFKVPIVIDKNNVIIAGHTRLLAAKELGLQEVPCIMADDLTPEQAKAFRLADNRVAEISTWDIPKLEIELKDLSFNMPDFGFMPSFDSLISPHSSARDDGFEVDPPEKPITQQGDIYILGNHRLLCGDATNAEDLSKLMQEESADLYLTDPPYNIAYEGKTEDKLTIKNDKMSDEFFLTFLTDSFTAAASVLAPGSSFYIWHSGSESYNFLAACKNAKLTMKQILIWKKNSMVLGRSDYQQIHEPCLYGWKEGEKHTWRNDRKQKSVLEFDRPQRSKEHPTMKPIPLFGYLINNSSQEGDIVLDSFGGSGTTLIACEQLGRRCRTVELDPSYCDVIVKRWESYTGRKAQLIE